MTQPECPTLTLLQWRILAEVASGADDREIAARLLTSPSSIRHRLRVIYPLLPLGDALDPRAAAAAWYLRLGQRWHQEARRDA